MADAELRAHATKIRKRLERAIPEPVTELDWKDPWQLVIATILSAQSTDKMVNQVTPELFRQYPTPAALGSAPQDAVEVLVKRTGFFRNKAKSIIGASLVVAERFGGAVPRTMDEMLELPGVARKTANVVLGSAYRIPTGFVVDTHVTRVSARLELTAHTDPVKIEQDLVQLFPKRTWVDMGHRFVLHGRYVCQAKKPLCERCPLNELCASARGKPLGRWADRADAERRLVESRGRGA